MKAQCAKTRGCFVQHHKPSNRFRCRSVKKRKKRKKKTRRKKTICADDSGCPEGQRCGIDNFCAPILNITEITTPQQPEPKHKGSRWKTARLAATSGLLHGDAVRMDAEIPGSNWRTGQVLKGQWQGEKYAYNKKTGDYIIWSQHVNQIGFDKTVAERAWQVYPGSHYHQDEAGNFVPQEGEVWYYNRAQEEWSRTLPEGVEFDADEVHQLSARLYGREHDLEGDVPHSHGESQGDGKTDDGDTIDGTTGEIIRQPEGPTTSGQQTDSIASVAEKRAEEQESQGDAFEAFLLSDDCPKLSQDETASLIALFD